MTTYKKSDFVKLKKTDNFISKKIAEVEESFEFLSKVNFAINFKTFKILMVLSSVAGLLIGILLENFALSLILAACIPLLEIEILHFMEGDVARNVEDMVIRHGNLIRNSYMYYYDVKEAIVTNMKRYNSPIKELFEEFKTEIDIYHYSVEESLNKIPNKIKSESLSQLIEQLILCNKDRANVSALVATIEQLNDKSKFLAYWANVRKAMITNYFTALIIVNLILGGLAYGFKDITKIFLKSGLSTYLIAGYTLILFITTISAMRNINRQF